MIKKSSGNDPQNLIFLNLIPPLWCMFVFNILWNVVFGLGLIILSFIMIIGYLASLIALGLIIAKGTTRIHPIIPIAFGIHTGWITIASIVNLYAYLVKIEWQGLKLNQELSVILATLLVLLPVGLFQMILNNPLIPIGTAWAIFGNYAKEGVMYSQYTFIPNLLLAEIVILLILSGMTFILNGNSLLPFEKK